MEDLRTRTTHGDSPGGEVRQVVEAVGDVLCFLGEALSGDAGDEDLNLSPYARRGLAGVLADCSRRIDLALCRMEPGS